jgi:hypothetical protein
VPTFLPSVPPTGKLTRRPKRLRRLRGADPGLIVAFVIATLFSKLKSLHL